VWWGEFYLALTILTAGYVLWKNESESKTAILLVLIAWIVAGEVDYTNTIANIVIDMVFLFVAYRFWYITRLNLWAILCIITIIQIIWHGLAPFLFSEEVWYYLAVRNVLYASQLPVIGWWAHGSFMVSNR